MLATLEYFWWLWSIQSICEKTMRCHIWIVFIGRPIAFPFLEINYEYKSMFMSEQEWDLEEYLNVSKWIWGITYHSIIQASYILLTNIELSAFKSFMVCWSHGLFAYMNLMERNTWFGTNWVCVTYGFS